MFPTTTTGINTQYQGDINAAKANGQALQTQDNNLVNTQTGQYNNAVANQNKSYGNLLNYTQNLPSYRNLYSNYFNQGAGNLGYNPSTTQTAANNLTATENIQSALPTAANQAANYSGATAGQIAQDYQNMANSINPALTNANNALTNQLALYNAANTFANNASNTAITGEGQKVGAYNDLYSNANTQAQNMASLLASTLGTQQTQGTATANQISTYNAAQQQALQNLSATQTMDSQAYRNWLATGSTTGKTSSSSGSTKKSNNVATPNPKTSVKSPSFGQVFSSSNLNNALVNPFRSLSNFGTDIGLEAINPVVRLVSPIVDIFKGLQSL